MQELIKYKGFQVAPAEIEGGHVNVPKSSLIAHVRTAVLLAHPDIADACVIGIPGSIPYHPTQSIHRFISLINA